MEECKGALSTFKHFAEDCNLDDGHMHGRNWMPKIEGEVWKRGRGQSNIANSFCRRKHSSIPSSPSSPFKLSNPLQKRFFVVRQGALRYYEDEAKFKAMGKEKGFMSCEAMTYQETETDKKGNCLMYCFTLPDSSQKTLECACESTEERDRWKYFVDQLDTSIHCRERGTAMELAQNIKSRKFLSIRNFVNALHHVNLSMQAQQNIFKGMQEFVEVSAILKPLIQKQQKTVDKKDHDLWLVEVVHTLVTFEDKLGRFCVLHIDDPGPVGELAFHVAFLYGQHALGKRMIETTTRFQVFNHVIPTTKLKTCATLKSCGSQDRDVE